MFSLSLVPGRQLTLALDAIHQFNETWIFVHVSPVWIRLKPLVVFIAQAHSRLQPTQCLNLPALQKISRREPVSDIVISLRDLPDFRRQLFVGFCVLSLGTKTDRENRTHTIHLRVFLKNLL